MGLSWAVAGMVKGYLGLLPHDYAVKTARKLRHNLDSYGSDYEVYASPAGPLNLGGLRRSMGEPADITIKEPETLRWIDACVKPGEVLWDVGSNIGLYAIYAAKRGAGLVVAFEPFGATYLQALKNIVANGVDRQVRALSVALSDQSALATLNLRSFEPGYATTLAGHELPEEQESEPIGMQWVMTVSGADLVRLAPDTRPDHVKIDVDGSEPMVLAGLEPLLPTLKSLFIEVLDGYAPTFEAEVVGQLAAAGLREVPVGEPSAGRNRAFLRPEAFEPQVTVI